eukprot:632086_1
MAALWYKETREVVCNYRIVLGEKKKNETKESRKQKKRRKKEEEEEPAVDRIVTAVEHTHTLGKGDIASKHHTTRDRIVSVWKGDIASHNHTTGDRFVSVWKGDIASPHHTTGDRIVSVWKGDIASHHHTHLTEHNKMNAKRTETQFILAQQKIPENSKTQPIDVVHKQQMQLNEKPQNESNIKQSVTTRQYMCECCFDYMRYYAEYVPLKTCKSGVKHYEITVHSLVMDREIEEGTTQRTKHKKQAPTLSDILYTSEQGDTIYCEPITDNLQPREIQCRTENWTDSWKHALSSLTDASISMQGYLCKMTASKFNSRGTLDKIQRRWFVLRGNYMTYYKTNLHTQPKSDKCVNLLGYKVNPVVHAKSKYAFELISAPKENQHKKSKSMKKNNYDQRYPSNTSFVERTKFILIPDLDVNEHKQREIRDKWVKSLRLATKGAFLWDVLLNLKVESPLAAAVDGDPTHRSSYDPHQHHHGHGYHAHGAQDHITSHTAFTSPHPHAHPQSVGTPPPSSSHGGYHSSYSKRNKGYHQSVLSAGHKNFKHSSDSLQAYSRRKYKQGNPNKKIGGNTQDYPDYRM